MWMAGGGIKPGITYGATDDLGFHVATNPVHVHDLQATILHLLGLRPRKADVSPRGAGFPADGCAWEGCEGTGGVSEPPWIGTNALSAVLPRWHHVTRRGLLSACVAARADGDARGRKPPAPSFSREIQPILAGHCLKCHGSTTQKADLDLRSPATMEKGGVERAGDRARRIEQEPAV